MKKAFVIYKRKLTNNDNTKNKRKFLKVQRKQTKTY